MKRRLVDDITVLSSVFPSRQSGFSYEENEKILNTYKYSQILTTGQAFEALDKKNVKDGINEYIKDHKGTENRVKILEDNTMIKSKLLYSIFLQDTYTKTLPLAEKFQIPFIFTLYPGGGFHLSDRDSDRKLIAIFNSRFFKYVICTQKITVSYLLKNHLCKRSQIKYIFGVVTPPRINTKSHPNSRINKSFNIVFCAHKYDDVSNKNFDKGYDVFIKVCKKLSAEYSDINFHVVGGYTVNDYDASGIKNLKFHGQMDHEKLIDFFQDMDIIVSPTWRNNGKPRGEFDGFPTASVTDAGLSGVAMFTTDPLNLNDDHYINNKEIVIIKHEVDDIFNKIQYYKDRPDQLAELKTLGRNKAMQLYSAEAQLLPRFKVFDDIIKKHEIYIVKNILAIAKHKLRIRTRIMKFMKG